jgi:hypothetical protein
MKDEHAQFSGPIPAAYDRYLGPMLFQPYAEDLAARLQVAKNGSVLELACGTGILTRALRSHLPSLRRRVGRDGARSAGNSLFDRRGWPLIIPGVLAATG